MDFDNIDKDTFLAEKEKLNSYASEQLNKPGITKTDTDSLVRLMKALEKYTYENRLSTRGLLAYIIRDSLSFDDQSLSERFSIFDDPPSRRLKNPVDHRIKYQTKKDKLRKFAKEQLNRPRQTKNNAESLGVLISILNEYSYADRLDMAELINSLIRDKLIFEDKSLAERFSAFAQSIRYPAHI